MRFLTAFILHPPTKAKIPSLFWLLTMMWLLAACEAEGLLTKEEKDARIDYQPKLVVESFICPADTFIRVDVRYAQPTIGLVEEGKGAHNKVLDATVILSDGADSVVIPYQKGGPNVSIVIFESYAISSRSFPIRNGSTYHLTITTPDGLKAEAFCTVPASTIDTNTVKKEIRSDGLVVEWQDIPNEKNYYRAFTLGTNVDKGGFTSIIAEYTSEIITDEGRDGRMVSVEKLKFIESEQQQNYSIYSELLLCNVDINYYDYHRTLANQVRANENPFSEPAPVYTNIKGGLGVFAAYNRIQIKR